MHAVAPSRSPDDLRARSWREHEVAGQAAFGIGAKLRSFCGTTGSRVAPVHSLLLLDEAAAHHRLRSAILTQTAAADRECLDSPGFAVPVGCVPRLCGAGPWGARAYGGALYARVAPHQSSRLPARWSPSRSAPMSSCGRQGNARNLGWKCRWISPGSAANTSASGRTGKRASEPSV